MSSATQVIVPSSDDIKIAVENFTRWLAQVAPGLDVVVCGGAAVVLNGSRRATKDLDVAIDFSASNYNVNFLKDQARRHPSLFSVGPVIYMAISPTQLVQLDMVTRELYFQPWSNSVVTTVDGISVLGVPMLLVQKIITARKRDYENVNLSSKRLSDTDDILFLMECCCSEGIHFGEYEQGCLTRINPVPSKVVEEAIGVLQPDQVEVTEFVERWNSWIAENNLDVAQWAIPVEV